MKRPAFRAGTFYESNPQECQLHVQKLWNSAQLPSDLPNTLYGGLVPHAGWRYSGKIAAQTWKAMLSANPNVNTIILFGADHTGTVSIGEVYHSGWWETPLGDVPINEILAQQLMSSCSLLRANPKAHAREHSLEVHVPILKAVAPNISIVPIGVPVDSISIQIGQQIGRFLVDNRRSDVCIVGSTDMSHTGGHFGHRGHGRGLEAEKFARSNDFRLLEIIKRMDLPNILPEVNRNHNACGGGAIVATMAAALLLGAQQGRVLDYTNSYVVSHESNPRDSDDTTVGYSSVVFV